MNTNIPVAAQERLIQMLLFDQSEYYNSTDLRLLEDYIPLRVRCPEYPELVKRLEELEKWNDSALDDVKDELEDQIRDLSDKIDEQESRLQHAAVEIDELREKLKELENKEEETE